MSDSIASAPPQHFNLAAHLCAQNAPRAAKAAYIDDCRTLTYGDLATRIRQFATVLHESGLRREERVLLLAHDTVDWPVAFLGAIYAGIVPVAVNTLLTTADYAYMLSHSRARAAIVSAALSPVLEEALQHAPVFCDQVEYHPFLAQDPLLELARANDVLVTAYSPLAHGRVADDATLAEIGEAHGKSAGQVALRWLLEQPGVSPIPKASSHERRVENFEVFDFELSDEERSRIAGLPKDDRQIDPDDGPDWDE